VTVPVPYDQQAMFAALKLLQEKVAGLEEGQAQMRRTIDSLRNECSTLKQELSKSREAKSTRPEVDLDEENVFDISIPQVARPKSQEVKATPPVPAPSQAKRIGSGETGVVEVLRETFKPNEHENIILREVFVPASSQLDSEKKNFGVEVKINFQGLSLG